jgi:hypothetical protein
MNWTTRLIVFPAICAMILVSNPDLRAQGVRELAPGVLRVIPIESSEEETFLGPIEISALTQFNWTPNFAPPTATLQAKASQVTLRHNVWNLEFAFKPLRMVHVDIPQPTGRMQRKLIWYMVYRVRNLGGHLTPVPVEDEHQLKTYTVQRVDDVMNVGAAQPTASIRFFPHFVLESRQVQKAYLDALIPVAIPLIEMREMRGAKLFQLGRDFAGSDPSQQRRGRQRGVGSRDVDGCRSEYRFCLDFHSRLDQRFPHGSNAGRAIGVSHEDPAIEFLAAWRQRVRARRRDPLRHPCGFQSGGTGRNSETVRNR